jgi:UDP-3-O-[3-hydroxymyristoyl] glucosamine N-acyltransferase
LVLSAQAEPDEETENMKLGEIANKLGAGLEGSPEIDIQGIRGIDEAGPHDLTFLSNPKYRSKLKKTQAAAVILAPGEPSHGRPAIRSENPYLDFARALEMFSPPQPPTAGIHPTAVIAAGARIGRNPSMGPYVVIEDGVEIGDDCVLKAHVVIYGGAKIGHRFLAHAHAVVRERVEIGNDVILQNGVVVGGDGFGFARRADGSYLKIVQAGTAIIEDSVEIQANACVDRATVGVTRIRRGVKIDNLVQVGHSCEVGENSLLCGQAGLAGTCKLGRNVILAGQVGVAGHLTIGDNVVATAQSGIPSDVEPNGVISGYPAIDNALWLKCSAAFSRLPEMYALYRKLAKSQV